MHDQLASLQARTASLLTSSRAQYSRGHDSLVEHDKSVEKAYKEANALLSDIIMNYRTVIGFGPGNI